MPRKRYSTEQIVTKLRQAEVELGRGLRMPQVCKKLGISEQTYYRWRKEYGGLRFDQAKRLKALEHENTRLKRLVADQALDNAILKEVASGHFCARAGAVRPCTTCAHGWACRSGGPVASSGTRGRRIGIDRWCPTTNRGWWRGSSSWRRRMGATGIGGSPGYSGGKAGQ